MGETDFKELYDDIFSKYSDLHKEYLYLREENQKLTEKLERLESDKVYAGGTQRRTLCQDASF